MGSTEYCALLGISYSVHTKYEYFVLVVGRCASTDYEGVTASAKGQIFCGCGYAAPKARPLMMRAGGARTGSSPSWGRCLSRCLG